MKINPLRDHVLVKPAEEKEQTIGGILIPDSAKEKSQRGEVCAVGPGTKEETMVLKAGDHVMYSKYSGTDVEIDGENYLIVRQADIYATLQ